MQDLKSFSYGHRKPRRRGRLVALLLLLLALAGAGVALLTGNGGTSQPAPQPRPDSVAPSGRIKIPLQLPPASASLDSATEKPALTAPPRTEADVEESPAPPPGRLISHRIESGESLSSIFKRYGLTPGLLHRITHSSKLAGELTRIRPGETLLIRFAGDNQTLQRLELQYDRISSLVIEATADGFTSHKIQRQVETRNHYVAGTISNSLYNSAKRAGLSDSLIMELADIFGWDIDFALEIRAGDSFSVIHEEHYLDGEKLSNGPILAAEFINQGRVYRAVRYTDPKGHTDYYTPEGRSMRKAFLRAPVDFRRISSRFTGERWHPVLGKKRPHRGVDYAAKRGTPVKASGDGKIIFRGRKGGYGKTLIIQHGQSYTTLYAHLSGFSKKARRGSRVKQGQVIGYVGSTGLATGPHLHYEFRVNGVHRNPLTVKLPASKPIDKAFLADFTSQAQNLVAQLDTINHTLLADVRR